jgi:hypothetical protein
MVARDCVNVRMKTNTVEWKSLIRKRMFPPKSTSQSTYAYVGNIWAIRLRKMMGERVCVSVIIPFFVLVLMSIRTFA